MNDLIEKQETDLAEKPQASEFSPLDAVLADPDKIALIDTDKIEKLFELQQRSIDAQAKRTFFSELTAARSKFSRVKRDKRNEQTKSKYTTLEAITSMLDPIIAQHGFSRSLTTDGVDPSGDTIFVLVVRHESGHSEESRLPLPIDDKGIKGNVNKTRIHAMGSAFTYAERILVTKFFGVETGDKDDDGNAAGGRGAEPEPLITVEQQAELTAWIQRAEMDETKLLAIYAVEKVAELPAKLYPGALRMAKIRHENNEAKRKQAQGDAA